jgi:hypothetical protein
MIPVAVEKPASEKSAKIRTRQEVPKSIFSDRPDISIPQFLATLTKTGFFNSHLVR